MGNFFDPTAWDPTSSVIPMYDASTPSDLVGQDSGSFMFDTTSPASSGASDWQLAPTGTLFGANAANTLSNPSVPAASSSGWSLSDILGLTSQASNAASQVLYATSGPSTLTRALGAIGGTTNRLATGQYIAAAPTGQLTSGGLLIIGLAILVLFLIMRAR